jgi:hypothetical protein
MLKISANNGEFAEIFVFNIVENGAHNLAVSITPLSQNLAVLQVSPPGGGGSGDLTSARQVSLTGQVSVWGE